MGTSKKSGDSAAQRGLTRREFLKCSAGTFGALSLSSMTFGCGGGGGGDSPGSFSVLVFSDIHFNPFYDSSLFKTLDSAPPGEWAAIFETSSIKAPAAWTFDTNYPSLVLALAGIKQNLGACPFVIYTGDLLGHNFPKTFSTLYGSEDSVAMESFADKTVAFVMGQVRASVGDRPVLFALGNSDSYLGALPEPSFLSHTAELFYTKFLNASVDRQAFLATFSKGGYYSAEPAGTNLTVIGLNTVPFAFPGTDVDAQLAWLDTTLAAAQAARKKVWLLMHIPPGVILDASAATPPIAKALMEWQPGRYESFVQKLAKYPGVVTLTLAAHTHMDEYRIMSPGNVLEITPSITPKFGNNPAFKRFTIDGDTLRPTDYQSLSYDLASLPPQFNSYYTFSTAYSMTGVLDVSLSKLYPALVTDSTMQALYRGHYYSGNNTLNPITNNVWPIYWSGIGNMVQSDFIKSVNSY